MTENKIQTIENAQNIIADWKLKDNKIVFTNGCFDIVHLGHIDYLEKSSKLGSKLVLGVNSDQSVRKLKGNTRPVVDEYARARMLAAFEFVHLVVVFDEQTPLELITKLMPDVLVKGDDYTVDNIVGAEVVLKNGGKVETVALVKGYSTTKIIEKIKKLN
ncbi:MAG: D-glycero-beta-D-manno-heptose 1-phosphate adenylyltransferase [Pseudarcicella sp.]|nr:D-glycero-beta-D-manno-heptose 1-phosphate adenylyltransferase [Pseudarcicella sp.]MBP6409503.1 D-glycero-beta-D-manno-heptose 1-phosphate adenylyltransferase [Pseudarcicella sp.]